MKKHHIFRSAFNLMLIQVFIDILLVERSVQAGFSTLNTIIFLGFILVFIAAGVTLRHFHEHIPPQGKADRKHAEFAFTLYLLVMAAGIKTILMDYSLPLGYLFSVIAFVLLIIFALYLYKHLKR